MMLLVSHKILGWIQSGPGDL